MSCKQIYIFELFLIWLGFLKLGKFANGKLSFVSSSINGQKTNFSLHDE